MTWNGKSRLPFCCDLLSVAMGKAPAGCAWVTVDGKYEYVGGGYTGGMRPASFWQRAQRRMRLPGKRQSSRISWCRATEEPVVFEAALWVWQQMQGEGHGA